MGVSTEAKMDVLGNLSSVEERFDMIEAALDHGLNLAMRRILGRL